MDTIGRIIKATMQEQHGNNNNPKTLDVCEVCGKPLQMELKILGMTKVVGCMCACEEEKRNREEQARRREEFESECRKNKKYSLMDEKARSAVFEKLTVTEENRKYITAAENYCRQWESNKRENNGLLFYGQAGRGKTTIACCIANRLLDKGISVKAMSVIDMLQRVKDSFRSYGTDGETELKSEIKRADLLILDDLGAEHKTDWSTSLVYEIIDARYRSCKPTIITTNLTMTKLREHLTDDNGVPRAYDRLIEMLSLVEFKTANYRQAISREKNYDFFKGAKSG